MLRKLVKVLAGLFLAAVVGIYLLPYVPVPELGQGSIRMEFAKALLQLGVVAVVATAVSLLVYEYQRERQNQDKQKELDRKALEYREDLLKAVLDRAMKCYSQTKKARRLLRARALSVKDSVTVVAVDRYDELLEVINDSQLEFENLARDVLNSQKAFSTPGELAVKFRSMDEYLKLLVTEYEQARRRNIDGVDWLQLDSLPTLGEFLRSSNEGRFHRSIVVPYHEIQIAVRGDLLHPQLPT